MKKLMIAAAIVCAAAMSQAAQIDWTITANTWYYSDKVTKAATGTTVYLINAADWTSIETAIKGGATAFTTANTGILDVRQTTNTKGYVGTPTAVSDALTAGTKYDYAYLVFDTRDPNDIKYFASGTQSERAYDPLNPDYKDAKSITFGSTQFSSATLSNGWQSVPEPTSALLLLLGVAGLALKRKRA